MLGVSDRSGRGVAPDADFGVSEVEELVVLVPEEYSAFEKAG
jgi:hypothetical protein